MKDETKQKLKELGLEGLELIAEDMIDKLFQAIELIVKDSENKIDDMILPTLPMIKEKVKDLINKIDGTEA